MPIPVPYRNENQDEFMSRCVEFLINEGTDSEQAVAICSQNWENKKAMKLKNRQPQFKSCLTQIKDIDEKGVVTFYGSVFGSPDRVKDIVDPGAYMKTITENFKEIQHYKNHDSTLMPGVIQETKEDDIGLMVRSKLMLKTQVGLETYEQYKAMAEAEKSMSHSIGYSPVREQKDDKGFNHLKEIFLFEVSTLTKRPAHPDALTIGIKSLDELVKEEMFYENLLKCDFSDAKLEQLEKIKDKITALIKESRRDIAPDLKDTPLKINVKFKL